MEEWPWFLENTNRFVTFGVSFSRRLATTLTLPVHQRNLSRI
jgi:hypothetical protein